MRCEVLVAQDSTLTFGDAIISTDIEIWSESTAYRTALSPSGPRDLAKIPLRYLNKIFFFLVKEAFNLKVDAFFRGIFMTPKAGTTQQSKSSSNNPTNSQSSPTMASFSNKISDTGQLNENSDDTTSNENKGCDKTKNKETTNEDSDEKSEGIYIYTH